MSSTRLVTLLGAAVRHQRHLRDLSQRQLAALAEVSQAAVARIERGERAPTIPVLERLLAAMDVQLVVGVEPLDAHLDALGSTTWPPGRSPSGSTRLAWTSY
ncbi:helix-turn-helix transcriptional regulator [Micromonospora sp. NPDC049171]|uniref:helix-turn-helix domain-containing protein n=1 Tax=Micromonospora sp. NPDC049171 TaxID=3155770 RepID=UPI0033E6E649